MAQSVRARVEVGSLPPNPRAPARRSPRPCGPAPTPAWPAPRARFAFGNAVVLSERAGHLPKDTQEPRPPGPRPKEPCDTSMSIQPLSLSTGRVLTPLRECPPQARQIASTGRRHQPLGDQRKQFSIAPMAHSQRPKISPPQRALPSRSRACRRRNTATLRAAKVRRDGVRDRRVPNVGSIPVPRRQIGYDARKLRVWAKTTWQLALPTRTRGPAMSLALMPSRHIACFLLRFQPVLLRQGTDAEEGRAATAPNHNKTGSASPRTRLTARNNGRALAPRQRTRRHAGCGAPV